MFLPCANASLPSCGNATVDFISVLGNSFQRSHQWNGGWTCILKRFVVRSFAFSSVEVMSRSESITVERTVLEVVFIAILVLTSPLRMLGQFEHVAESYFSGYNFDLGERQLDRILSVEHDLDSFIAAIGLSKYELETAVRDEGWGFFPVVRILPC